MGKYTIIIDPDFDFANKGEETILLKSREDYKYEEKKSDDMIPRLGDDYENLIEMFVDTLAYDMSKKLNIKYYPFDGSIYTDEEYDELSKYWDSYNEDEYLKFDGIGYDQWPTATFTIDVNSIDKIIESNFEFINHYNHNTYITNKSKFAFYYSMGFSGITIFENTTSKLLKEIKKFYPKRIRKDDMACVDRDEKGNIIWMEESKMK